MAVAFLLFHLPYLPASLEDLDSINFALGLRHYDVANHQPHPPGYPVFIALAHVAAAVVRTVQQCGDACDAKALSALSVVAGSLGVIALFALFNAFERIAGPADPVRTRWNAWAAALVAATSPLYWFTAARPLSDAVGLAAAVAVQAWALTATSGRSFAAAAFVAGVATGIRSQVAWLTVPLLAWTAWHRDVAGPDVSVPISRRAAVSTWSWVWPFAIGALVWAIPLLALTGGPRGYWRAVFNQGAEDLTGVQMLWTTPTPRVFVSALYYAFVAPWALWSVAIVVIVFGLLGAVLLARYWRPVAVVVAVAFIPYLAFDLLFQETFTTRYALPLVVPVAYLAVRGAAAFGWRAAIGVALVLSAYDAHIGGTSIAGYARAKAPAFRMLDDMQHASASTAPALAMDRREQLDMRRPIVWVGDRMPPIERRLPAPPQHEWLEMVGYWNGGGRNPVWFVADPLRTDIQLVQHGDPVQYRWSVPYPVLLGGVRPNEMDWYRIDRPDWYVGSGWSLTPESAGVSQLDRRGLEHGPIDAWVATPVLAGGASLVIGGRNFDPTVRPRLTIAWGKETLGQWTVTPGAFLELATLPLVTHAPLPDFQHLTVTSEPPTRMAIEQFDIAPPNRAVFGFGPGWNEQEYNPYTGRLWRWLSERGEVAVLGDRRPIRLHLEGESPKVYFSKPSRLTVRVGDKLAFDDVISEDFAIDITIPGELVAPFGQTTAVVLETDQVYVPAERSSRTRDRRHLGLRIYKCELRKVE